MFERDFDSKTKARYRLPRQTEAQQATAGLPPRYDPLARITGRIGNPRSHAAILNRTTASQPSQTRHALLRLQRQYGNRYVQRVVALARQGESNAEVSPEVEQAIQRALGRGQTLDSRVRTQMESALGADFSGVRVHTDAEADGLNRTLNARAFTTGQDLFFRQGEYNPGGSGGRKLLAHELTHVVQQLSGAVPAESGVSHPDDTFEKEARSVAEVITSGSPVIVRDLQGVAARPTVQRQHGKRALAANNLPISRDETLTSNPRATRPPHDWYSKTVDALRLGSNRAHIAANRYAVQVERAAGAFKDYAKPQVEELKGQATGADLIGGLAAVFPSVLPHFIASRVAAGFFRELATNTAQVARNTMVSAVQDAVRLGSSVKDLEAAIDLLPKRSKDLASTLPVFVQQKFDQRVGDLIKTPRGEWTAEDALVVRPFVEALMANPAGVTPEQLDIIIETQLGLPSPAHTLDFQVQLYRTWVEVFARKRIVAESSPYWHIYQIVSPRDVFGEMARAEGEAQAQARRRRLESVMPR